MKPIKRVFSIVLGAVTAAVTAAGLFVLAGCTDGGSKGGNKNEFPEDKYAVKVCLPDGSLPAEELPVQLCTAMSEDGTPGACHVQWTDQETGIAVWDDLELGEYEVHIEACPAGYTFDNTKYKVTETVLNVVVYLEENGPADLTSFEGGWHSLDGTTYRIDVEGQTLYFNDEAVETKASSQGVVFSLGDVTYTLAHHLQVSGACSLFFGENEEFLLPEDGLDRVSVPDDLNGTWSCLAVEGISLILDGTNFSYSSDPESIDDGYVVAVNETASGYDVVAVIETGDNAGVYPMSYSNETGYLTVRSFDVEVEFWKSGFGSEADPTVLDVLEGDYTVALNTSKLEIGWDTRYYFVPVYYAYTPEKDEDYVLWNPNSDLSDEFQCAIVIYTGLMETDEDVQIVLDWGSYIPEEGYEVIHLTAGTTYRFRVSAQPDSFWRPMTGITVSFSFVKGEVPPVTTVPIPALYHGTWYNTADKTQTVAFFARRALWNDAPFSVTSANEEGVHATIEGEEVVFTLEGATLKATKGTQTSEFTLVSGNPVSVAAVFAGFYASDDEVIVIASNSFAWVGHEVQLAAADSTVFTLVVGNEIWTAACNGGSVVLTKRGGTETKTLVKCDLLNSFSAPYVGTFTADGVSLTVTGTGVTFNNKTVEVWRAGSGDTERLLFAAENTVYALSKSATGLELTDLSTGETVSLS